MSAAEKGTGGRGPADLCPAATRLEEDLAGGVEDKRAKAECAGEYIKCGRRHGEAGRLEAAEKCFKKAVGIHCVWTACADECGRIAARLEAAGKHAGAVVWYGRAVGYTDGALPAPQKKGKDTRRKKWASRCIRCWGGLVAASSSLPSIEMEGPYRAAAAADPSRAATHVQMGDIGLGRGKHDEAAALYGRALEIDPLNADAAFGAGRALEGGRQWARAALQYANAARNGARLRKECAAGCARCAAALQAAGDPAAAVPALRAAAELDPSHAPECARALDRMGRLGEALPVLEAVAEAGSLHALECARMHRRRADGLALEREQGGTASAEEAVSHYADAVRWYQNAARAAAGAAGGAGNAEAGAGCLECARALDRMGRPDEALSAFRAAAETDTLHALECARMHRRRADGLVLEREQREVAAAGGGIGAGRAEEAVSHYADAVRWYQNAARAAAGAAGGAGNAEAGAGCLECARALDRMGRPDEALSAFRAAAGLDASHALECARMHRRRADGLAAGGGKLSKKAKKAYGEALAQYGTAARGGGQDGAQGLREAAAICEAVGRHREAAAKFVEAYEMDEGAGRNAGDGGRSRAACVERCCACAGRLAARGNFEGARECLERAIAADPGRRKDFAGRCAAWGSAEHERGRHAEAAECFRTAISVDGGGAEAWFGLADALAKLGRHREALGAYSEARGHAGRGGAGAARAGLGMAGACEGLGRYAEAAWCLLEAAGADPSRRTECSARCAAWGSAEHERGRYAEAAECFRTAISVNGGGAEAWFGLADALAKLGRHREALGAYSEARGHAGRGGAGAARAGLGMAGACEGLGRYAEAAWCLLEAAGADPSRRTGCSARCAAWGSAMDREGRHGEASECFEAAVSIDGENAEARLGRAGLMRRTGRIRDALHDYSGARRPGNPDQRARAYAGLALALAEMSNHVGGAELACMAAAVAGPGDDARCAELADHCSKWGDVMYGREHYDGASRCYAMALSIDSGNAGAHTGSGNLKARQGRFGAAMKEYRAALRADPRSAVARAGVTLCKAKSEQASRKKAAAKLVAAGAALCKRARHGPSAASRLSQYLEAEEEFDRAIELDPGNTEARMGAGRALRKAAHLDHSGDKADYYRRALAHYEALPSSYNTPASAYWKGVCKLHVGGQESTDAKEVMGEGLSRATPKGRADLIFCGRICDILGYYKTACTYYAESLKENPRYTPGFYGRVEQDRFHEESPAPLRPDATSTSPATYVLDANVIIDCEMCDESRLPPNVISLFKKIRDAGHCCVPRACFDEAYGVLTAKLCQDDNNAANAVLDSWRPHVHGLPEDHDAADACMQKAREAMMTAWLYSSKDTKEEWRDAKFGPRTPYCGGPPTGRDVLILATAAHLGAGREAADPRRILLVTSDRDFLFFRRYIREVLSVEVIEPDRAAGLVDTGLLEGSGQEDSTNPSPHGG